MTIVARKTIISFWALLNTCILVELVGIGLLLLFARTPNVSYGFMLIPAAIVVPTGPLVFYLGVLERRKLGITVFFDRDGISWECAGAILFFWLPAKRHYHQIKWDEILGAKLVHGKWGDGEGSYAGPVVLIGVTRCESMTPAELKDWQEFVLTNLGRPPWNNTLPVTNYEQKLWNPQEIVAQIEQTISDKALREQWGEPPQFDGGKISAPDWANTGPIKHKP